MIKRIYSLFLVCLCFYTNAQNLRFENFTTKDGLLSDEVYNIHQDRKGYIWLFTNYGAMKYNGKAFEMVLKNLPFNESFIYSYYENEKGHKWVANSNAKIYEIINDSAYIVKGTESISEELKKTVSDVYQLFVDDSLNIYLITRYYSYKLCKNKKYQVLNLSQQIKNDTILIHAIEFKNDFISIWNYAGHEKYEIIAKGSTLKNKLKQSNNLNTPRWDYKGLEKSRVLNKYEFINAKLSYKNGTEGFIRFKTEINRKSKYFKRNKNDIYFCIHDKIEKICGNGTIKEIPINAFILNFTKDKNNHLWVGTYNKGLFELDENDSLVNHYFEDKSVNCILNDSENGLWVSTEGSGLFHCKDLSKFYYTESEPLGSPISFIRKIKNQLFIANLRGNVYLVKDKSINKIDNEDLAIGEPLDMIKYNTNFLINFRNGSKIVKLNNTSLASTLHTFDSNFHSYKSMKIGVDSFIFIERRGAVIIHENKIITVLRFNYKTFWCELKDDILLIGTENGVYQLINNQLFQPKFLAPTANCIVTKIVKDNFNNYWFCTKGSGLFKLTEKNKLLHFTNMKGLPSQIINDISFKSDNSILLSTNKGCFLHTNFGYYKGKWSKIYEEDVKSALTFNGAIYLATRKGLIFPILITAFFLR